MGAVVARRCSDRFSNKYVSPSPTYSIIKCGLSESGGGVVFLGDSVDLEYLHQLPKCHRRFIFFF
jgi:hypothetical protein